jgi:hypothetical protein
MARVLFILQMALSTLGYLVRIKQKGKGQYNILMEMFMKESGRIRLLMVLESILGKMEIVMKVNGL